jgi:hypothetical protein
MSIWYAKDNIIEIPTIACSESIILDLKYSSDVPSVITSGDDCDIKDQRQYKKYSTYEKVKKYCKLNRSFLKINEIIRYYDLDFTKNVLLINFNSEMWSYPSAKVGEMVISRNDDISDIDTSTQYDFVVINGAVKDTDSSVDQGNVFPMLLREVFTALYCQEPGADMILRMFGTTHKPSIQLIDMLSRLYENVSLFKPHVSRDYSTEKYLICRKFNGHVPELNISENKKMYIKDIFYKKSFEIRDDIITTLSKFNDMNAKRRNLCLGKPDIDSLQNVVAQKYCDAFLHSRVNECKHMAPSLEEGEVSQDGYRICQCVSCYETLLI